MDASTQLTSASSQPDEMDGGAMGDSFLEEPLDLSLAADVTPLKQPAAGISGNGHLDGRTSDETVPKQLIAPSSTGDDTLLTQRVGDVYGGHA